jgi:exonuclease III
MGTHIDLNLFTLNCNGLNGCIDELLHELYAQSNIIFLCEHWLQQYEIPSVEQALSKKGYVSYLKSSVNPEEVLYGRPYGGTGFVCKNVDGIHFQNVDVDNDRISCLRVIQHGTDTQILNIFGIYLPYCNGSADQASLYAETLDKLQSLIDDCNGSPVVIMGDMNANLPLHSQLARYWYRSRPFTSHSLMLHDFLVDNELCVANFLFDQNVNYTYEKGNAKSYIDHVFISKYLSDSVLDCKIVDNCNWVDVSDHLPIRTKVQIQVDSSVNPSDTNFKDTTVCPKYPKVNWKNPVLRQHYANYVNDALNSQLNGQLSDLCCLKNVIQIQNSVNVLCDKLTAIMHEACKPNCNSGKGRQNGKRVPWWSYNCTVARDRTRFWRSMWLKCNKDRNCHVFYVYKHVKKLYRSARRNALKDFQQRSFQNLFNIFRSGNPQKFWNTVRAMKDRRVCNTKNINLSQFYDFFADKFSNNSGFKSPVIVEAEDDVSGKFSEIQSLTINKQPFTPNRIRKFIKKLKPGRAPGYDGVTPEHLKYSIDTKLPEILSLLLNTCVKYGILPQCFRTGLLIPILKKPNLDPSTPTNYRPIIVSSVFTKIVEHAMLESVSGHVYHDLQFGFIEARGTNMAICTAKDTIAYVNSRGTTVYACALDAEKAFDGVPHSVLLKKCEGVLPDYWWRILYTWYKDIKAVVKWDGNISQPLSIEKGTRQGGLTSPLLFNLLYQDLIHYLSNHIGGMKINNVSYNVFCYADDLLLVSTTVTGLQSLIDKANEYIVNHGLSFNSKKSSCIILGKNYFVKEPSWSINGDTINTHDEIDYLGAILSNSNNCHLYKRTQSCRRSFYNLQSVGLCNNGVKPHVISYVWKTVLQPILLYGNECYNLTNREYLELGRLQSKLVKTSLGLSKYLRSTPLLDAMRINRVHSLVNVNTLRLFKSALLSSTRAREFYTFTLSNNVTAGNLLSHRFTNVCKLYNFNTFNVLFNDEAIAKCIKEMKVFPSNDGIVDSCVRLLQNYNANDKDILRLLLRY